MFDFIVQIPDKNDVEFMKRLDNIRQNTYNGWWSLQMETIYKMCENNFQHTDGNHIISKIWVIGRVFSAKIERVNIKNKPDDFDLIKQLVKVILENETFDANLDNEFHKKFEELKSKCDQNPSEYQMMTEENFDSLFELFEFVMGTFKKATGTNMASLTSKYLHFHFPKLYFILDSKACETLSKYIPNWRDNLSRNIAVKKSKEYYQFCQAVMALRDKIKDEYPEFNLIPRQIDHILIV